MIDKKAAFRNVVIFRTDRIGEVLLSTVSVDIIKRALPEARVSFVTSGYARPLLEGRKDIEKIMVFDTVGKKPVINGILKLSSALRREKFDTAVVLNPHKALHLACFFAGIPVRVGYDRKWGFLLNRKMRDERQKGEKHEVEYTGELLSLLGICVRNVSPRLFAEEKLGKNVDVILRKEFPDINKPLVVIHPGSSNPSKIWAVSKYRALADRIKSDFDVNVAVVGSQSEKEMTSRLVKSLASGAVDLAGKLDLGELAVLLKRSSVFIANDTGPMHMAAALGTPVVAVFKKTVAGTNPARWRPYTEKAVVFHEADEPDRSMRHVTGCAYRWKKEVSAEDVFSAVKDILDRHLSAREEYR